MCAWHTHAVVQHTLSSMGATDMGACSQGRARHDQLEEAQEDGDACGVLGLPKASRFKNLACSQHQLDGRFFPAGSNQPAPGCTAGQPAAVCMLSLALYPVPALISSAGARSGADHAPIRRSKGQGRPGLAAKALAHLHSTGRWAGR